MIKDPKISIITICKNSSSTIEETIKSVIKQSYNNIEFIIVDGKSNDSTLSIIEKYKENMIDIDINEFFKEYNINNKVFATIEIDEKNAKIFLNTKIRGSKIKKTIKVEKNNLNEIELNDKIILRIKDLIKDLIKSQNLIDVRTPSFLNVKINLANKNTLVEFDNRVKKIDLIDEFYVQQLNKDYVLVKIRYLGKISKIMNKLKDVDIELKMIAGQWQLNILK